MEKTCLFSQCVEGITDDHVGVGFAGSFGSTQGRLKKAIIEYVILQGPSLSPL